MADHVLFSTDPLDGFHPAVAAWFRSRFPAPTEAQRRAWPAIRAGRHALVAAPTGSGKTLAAFLAALDGLFQRGLAGELADETSILYISPLKALSNDVQKNLQEPLAGIRAELAARGSRDVEIRTAVRTGDTPQAERAAAMKRPPHVFVTTPESLYILLTSDGGRRLLRTVRTVIVDEVHAVVGTKRGSHLSLSLERLCELAGAGVVRIGLSATQSPIEEVARFLVGSRSVDASGQPACAIVDAGHARPIDLAIEIPSSPLEPILSNETWAEIYDRIAELVLAHRTTLVFVNTRRLAERAARQLSERLGAEHVTSHHGSLSREQRLASEQRLKSGELKALVATASLELGIDVGEVDLVVQVGSTRSIAALLQRVGRSGHAVRALPKGRIFPVSRDELVECCALLDSVRRGELDRLSIPQRPLDILAQHLVAAAGAAELEEEATFELVRGAWPYRELSRADFDAIVAMLADGFTTRRGRRGAWIHHDAVNGRIRARKGARLVAITSGGAIPDQGDYDVVLDPAGVKIGTVNEDFAIESIPGDVFQLGNSSWRILKVETGRVRVADAEGQPPTVPFWLGEAPARTDELSRSVSRLRIEIETRLVERGPDAALAWLVEEVGVHAGAAEQVVEYLAAARAALGTLPTHDTLILERFFDESGGMQLVVHSPLGARINRAWGLALRKRFCRKFNFELQAAASEDAVVLSLGPTHSFPLEEVFSYLQAETVRDVLVQAMLDAPMFGTRWRWNATRALAVVRQRGGRRVPPALQRMQADDLMALVFPDQQACAENLTGPVEVPDHPLVRQTVHDCLTEAMDLAGLETLLRAMASGEKRLVARDLPAPSPMAAEILGARPYAFLDDAPAEERRTLAVQQRRWLDPESAGDVGALDEAAIQAVRDQAWPQAATADELHDALSVMGFATPDEVERGPWLHLAGELTFARRATRGSAGGRSWWIAVERLPQFRAAVPGLREDPPLEVPSRAAARAWTSEEAHAEIVRGRLEALGPVTAERLVADGCGDAAVVGQALLALEREGFVLRGHFTPAPSRQGLVEWCDRRLLARIHRATLSKLRAEIAPVTLADLQRFLFAWQHVGERRRRFGMEGLAGTIEQLAGFEAPASAWESDILPARLEDYRSEWLDLQCLSGRLTWARLTPPKAARPDGRGPSPVRATPVTLGPRAELAAWATHAPPREEDALSSRARAVVDALERRGALFLREIAGAAHLLPGEVEDALGELVGAGLVTSDSFAGLRALLAPTRERRPAWRRVSANARPLEASGRWSLVSAAGLAAGGTLGESDASLEPIARALLRRYGVVFKLLLAREDLLPPWRELLRVYHRLEARGEIRGGRFVSGPAGEQFALPEAVTALRALRRAKPDRELVALSAADPLCLLGVIAPGRRVPAIASHRVLYRDGEAIATLEAGRVTWLVELDDASRWAGEKALRARAAARLPRASSSAPRRARREADHGPASPGPGLAVT